MNSALNRMDALRARRTASGYTLTPDEANRGAHTEHLIAIASAPRALVEEYMLAALCPKCGERWWWARLTGVCAGCGYAVAIFSEE